MLVHRLRRNFNRLSCTQNAITLFQKISLRHIMPITTSVATFSASKKIVGITQMRATNSKSWNLQQVKQLVEKAKEKDVKFLFFPECCDFLADNSRETIELSEPLTGPNVAAYADLARKNNMWLSLGGIHETILDSRGNKTDKVYNSHVIIDSNGDIVKVYHKLHLFDAETPDMQFCESDVVTKGERITPILQTPIGILGLQICYDLRFPEVATKLRKLGAQILSYPAAFVFSTGQAHWEILLRARAIENQCYVVAPAQIGFHNQKRQSYGHALIVDPWGKILATTDERELDIATAEIDLNKIDSIRQKMPCFEHRRTDVYSLTAIEAIDLERIDRRFGTNIIPGETIFFESPHCFAFTNLRCVVKGHVVISTKRTAPRLKDFNHDELTDLFSTACKIQCMLEEIYGTSAATLTVQDGADAGQTIKHVHFHVMPRSPGDFGENDQIYVLLEKVAQDSDNRHLDEMVAEADIYRKHLANRHPILHK